MKIAFMGPGESIHFRRWIEWFHKQGHELLLITDNFEGIHGINQVNLEHRQNISASRLRRCLSLEFNSYQTRKLIKIVKIDSLIKWMRIKRAIRKFRPDILHLHTMFFPQYLGVFTGYHPLVVTPWNGDIVWKYQWSFFRKLAVKMGLRFADAITVDSNELKDKVLTNGNYRGKTHYVSFGVDTSIFNPEAGKQPLPKEWGIDDDAPIVLSTRSFEQMYNIDIIIKAIPCVLSKFPKTIFVFSWHSESRKDILTDLVKELGVEHSVRFVGKVTDRRQLASLDAHAAIYVTIPQSDTIAISLLEAMACGAAPVISDLDSPKECITHGKNGLVVPLRNVNATAQAIVDLLSDNGMREIFMRRNIELVKEQFEWDANMRKAEEMYMKLCRRSKCKS